MMNPATLAILWPTLALVGLIFLVWFLLLQKRFAHVAANRPTSADFANVEAEGRYFRPVERPARNLANLFEMPVLYFALVPLLILTNGASVVQVALAWAFVALRLAHTVIHIGNFKVKWRARVYIASGIVLFAMWLGFAFDLLVTAGVPA